VFARPHSGRHLGDPSSIRVFATASRVFAREVGKFARVGAGSVGSVGDSSGGGGDVAVCADSQVAKLAVLVMCTQVSIMRT
jgi:hypothetical protein